MQQKKNSKVNVDRKAPIYREIGIIIALMAVILAFEVKFPAPELQHSKSAIDIEEDFVLAQPTKEKKQPKPKLPQATPDKKLRPNLRMKLVTNKTQVQQPTEEQAELLFDNSLMHALNGFKVEDEDEKIHHAVEEMPHPVDGFDAFYQNLYERVIYPEPERNRGIEGKVFLQFVVEKDGSITQVKIVEGTRELNTRGLNRAALQGFDPNIKWRPGYQNGEPVRVRFTIPIEFTLR